MPFFKVFHLLNIVVNPLRDDLLIEDFKVVTLQPNELFEVGKAIYPLQAIILVVVKLETTGDVDERADAL